MSRLQLRSPFRIRGRLEIAIVEPRTRKPHVRLAIEGRQPDGWYRMGPVTVRENSVH